MQQQKDGISKIQYESTFRVITAQQAISKVKGDNRNSCWSDVMCLKASEACTWFGSATNQTDYQMKEPL